MSSSKYSFKELLERGDFVTGTDKDGVTKNFYIEDIQGLLNSATGFTRAQLLTLASGSDVKIGVSYKVTDANSGADELILIGASTTEFFSICWNLSDTANLYDYDISTDTLILFNPSGAGEANTASNVGLTGKGLYDSKSGVELRFKNIAAGSSKVNVSEDAPNKAINVDIVENQVNALALNNAPAEAGANQTNEARVKAALDGATIDSVTVATGDKVLIQDVSDGDNLKTATTQSIANLKTSKLQEDTAPKLAADLDAQNYNATGFTKVESKSLLVNAVYSAGTSGAAKTISWLNGQLQTLTLTGNVTITFTDPENKGDFTLFLVQDATGGRSMTWPASVHWGEGSAYDFSQMVANEKIAVDFKYDGANYYASVRGEKEKKEAIGVACSDETTALTTGVAKATFRMPYAMTLTEVRASLTGAGSTSGTTTIDINENGTTVLSTKLTIDQGEKTSTTAATAPVISDSALADDSEITIDIDAVTGGADETGLKVWLIGTRV